MTLPDTAFSPNIITELFRVIVAGPANNLHTNSYVF